MDIDKPISFFEYKIKDFIDHLNIFRVDGECKLIYTFEDKIVFYILFNDTETVIYFDYRFLPRIENVTEILVNIFKKKYNSDNIIEVFDGEFMSVSDYQKQVRLKKIE